MSTLTLKSRESFLGSALRVRVEAEPLENGLYKIERAEWDRTFGPVMARAAADLVSDRRQPVSQKDLMCMTHGYIAMDSDQTREFHSLVQAFGTAANRNYAAHMKGAYKESMLAFADSYEKGHVVVSHEQLSALTTMTRAAADFARRDTEFPGLDAFWQKQVHENPSMTYRTGLRARLL